MSDSIGPLIPIVVVIILFALSGAFAKKGRLAPSPKGQPATQSPQPGLPRVEGDHASSGASSTRPSERPAPPRVFISYSHDNQEHVDWVTALSRRLREDGIETWIDRYVPNPPEGWPRWMLTQIDKSDFVLLICTEVYRRRFEGKEARGVGLGATWEGQLVTQKIYQESGKNERFVPIVPDGGTHEHVPAVLQGTTRYFVMSQYAALYRRLTSQPEIRVPPVAPGVQPVPPIEIPPLQPRMRRP